MVERFPTAGIKSPNKKEIIIVKKGAEVDRKLVEQFYPVLIDGKEYLPSTATWKAYECRYEEAIDLFNQIRHQYLIGHDEILDYRVFFNHAFCYNALEMYEHALIELEMVTYLKPDFLKGHFLKAQVLTSLGRFNEAEKELISMYRDPSICEDDKKEVEDAMKHNIYEALIALGHDEERAGYGSTYCPDIDHAIGCMDAYEENMAYKLAMKISKYQEEYKKTRCIQWTLWKNICRKKAKDNKSSCTIS